MGARILTVEDNSEIITPPRGRVVRVGIIPYVRTYRGKFFLIGRAKDGHLTDMGGGCKYWERPIECLKREIEEEAGRETREIILDNLSRSEIYRQTGETYDDLGYPFRQRFPGPIHRYYLLLELDSEYLSLIGGETGGDEVVAYEWMSFQQLRSQPREKVNCALRSFFRWKNFIT